MLNNDYAENLFRSIDTIIAERIRKLPYDQTQIAEIIDNTNAANGIYTISADNQFEELVVSDNPTYEIGDKVYVLRVAGSDRRFIIGMYLRNNGRVRINRIFEEKEVT